MYKLDKQQDVQTSKSGMKSITVTKNKYRETAFFVAYPFFFTCLDCESWGPLGMTDGSIKESQLSVSSIFQKNTHKAGINGPYHTGLHREEYWAPASGLPSHDRRQYIQVDFRSLIDVKMVRKSTTWRTVKLRLQALGLSNFVRDFG